MIPILVTGGAGYIGSQTAKVLARSGYNPVVLDNLSTGHQWAAKWGPMLQGDIADVPLVRRAIENFKIRAVIHFAANAYVRESINRPRKYFRNNLANTLSLLDALIDGGVRYVVFSSTCATYGIPDSTPISEDHHQRPISPYGESKLAIERVLHWYGKAYGLRSVSLRYFNAAGADSDGELGELHAPETHLIPLVIQAALGQLPEVQVFGSDFPTPDGSAIRDYIHVEDLARAHVLALQHILRGGPSCALNLGAGRGHSVLEVIRMVERVAGLKVRVQLKPRHEGDPPVLVARSTQAAQTLGWFPKRSDLETIVRTAWFRHQRQLLSQRWSAPANVVYQVERGSALSGAD